MKRFFGRMRSNPYETFLIAAALLGAVLPIVFWIIADPGHTWLIADMLFFDLLPAAALTALALGLRSRFLAALSVLTASFYLIAKVGVIVMYRMSFLPLTFDSLSLLLEHTDHDGVKAMIGEHYYLWTPVCALLLLTLIVCLRRIAVRFIRTADDARRNRVLVCVMIYLLISLIANARYTWYREVNTYYEDNYVGQVITPLSLSFGEVIRDAAAALQPNLNHEQYGRFYDASISPESAAWLKQVGLIREEKEKPLPPLPAFDRIVIVALESFDGDFLNSNNPDLPPNLTPQIDGLKKKYLSFSRCYSASQPTSWGLTALLLSRPDYKFDRDMRSVSLCDLLREKGIRSFYFSPIGGEFGDNRKRFRKLFRFDAMFFEEELRRDYPYVRTSGGWGLSDESMYRAALDFLRKEKPDRYFLLLSTMDTHSPYHVSGPDAILDFGNAFFNSIHTTDDNAGRFVQEFMADPTLFDERTLLIVTADHSACHGYNGTRRKILIDPAPIPLVLITKNNRLAQYFEADKDKMFSTIDLPATFTRMIGSKVPDTFMGDDISAKKPFALTRDYDENIRLFLPDGSEVRFFKTHPELKKPQEKALCEFYGQFYRLNAAR